MVTLPIVAEEKKSPVMAAVAATLKKTLGRDLVFVDNLEQNGVFDPTTPDTLYLRSDAEQPLMTVAFHEAAHAIKTTDPEAHKQLMGVIADVGQGLMSG